MSQGNQVELILVPELVYNQIPPLDVALGGTIRHTSENLSGTPTTTTSAEQRTDRMSGGLIATGLEVGGPIAFELSADPVYHQLFQMALCQAVPTTPAIPIVPTGPVVLTKDPANDQLATIVVPGATFLADLAAGGMIVLKGFVNVPNNGPAQVTEVTDDTTIKAIVRREAVDETLALDEVIIPAMAEISADVVSALFGKSYLDVTHAGGPNVHGQEYGGGIVNGFTLDMSYGAIATGTWNILAASYRQNLTNPSLHQQIDAAGGEVAPAGTAQPLNASIDMGLVTVDGQPTDYCINKLGITFGNGATPQNCIGHIGPMRYNLGTVGIAVTADIYNSDPAYDKFMPAKLTLEPVGITMGAGNADGGYVFELPAVQLTFPDPSNPGGDSAVVMMNMAGAAKVAEDGGSAIKIFYW